MVRLIMETVVRNLSLSAAFVAGGWVASAVAAWIGRDVTVIIR